MKHIVDFASEAEVIECMYNQNVMDEDARNKAAKQIIGILSETKLPICMAEGILDFCKYAIRFSSVESTREG